MSVLHKNIFHLVAHQTESCQWYFQRARVEKPGKLVFFFFFSVHFHPNEGTCVQGKDSVKTC